MAKKGDLAIVKRQHSSVGGFGSGTSSTEHATYAVGKVRKANRFGDILEVDLVGGGIARRSDYSWKQVLTEPRERIDVDAMLDAAKRHHWEGHPNQPKEFDSLDDIVAIAKPLRKPHPVLR